MKTCQNKLISNQSDVRCEAQIVSEYFFKPGYGIELCKNGHLTIIDPLVKDGSVMIWRFKP